MLQQQQNNSAQQIQKLQHQLNASVQRVQVLQHPLNDLSSHTLNSTCNEIFQQDATASTGTYRLNTAEGTVNVTCDFDVQLPPHCPVRGWQEIANIDLSDPTDSCPSPLREITSPTRRCEKSSGSGGCESVFFPTYRMPFTKLCGRVVGYASGSPNALETMHHLCSSGCETIDDPYVDGISITYSCNNSRAHIWTLVAGPGVPHPLVGCPCGSMSFRGPSFVGDDFYCETVREGLNSVPLWEGEGCTDYVPSDGSCCENSNFPWFCREFDQRIVTDNIEVRVCTDELRINEDIDFELLKLYIQ